MQTLIRFFFSALLLHNIVVASDQNEVIVTITNQSNETLEYTRAEFIVDNQIIIGFLKIAPGTSGRFRVEAREGKNVKVSMYFSHRTQIDVAIRDSATNGVFLVDLTSKLFTLAEPIKFSPPSKYGLKYRSVEITITDKE